MLKKRKPCVFLAVILVLALVGGCASLKSFLAGASDKVCNFNMADSEEAQMARQFIAAAAPIVGVVGGVSITDVQAMVILDSVATAAQTGTCVTLKELQAALDFFDNLSAQFKQTKGLKKDVMGLKVPGIVSLRAKAVGK